MEFKTRWKLKKTPVGGGQFRVAAIPLPTDPLGGGRALSTFKTSQSLVLAAEPGSGQQNLVCLVGGKGEYMGGANKSKKCWSKLDPPPNINQTIPWTGFVKKYFIREIWVRIKKKCEKAAEPGERALATPKGGGRW